MRGRGAIGAAVVHVDVEVGASPAAAAQVVERSERHAKRGVAAGGNGDLAPLDPPGLGPRETSTVYRPAGSGQQSERPSVWK